MLQLSRNHQRLTFFIENPFFRQFLRMFATWAENRTCSSGYGTSISRGFAT